MAPSHFLLTSQLRVQQRLLATKKMHNNCNIYDLSSLTVIAVRGNDAALFLQNLLTIDIKLIDNHHHSLGAHCDAKGRMLALFRIFQWQESYCLQLPITLSADVLKTLKQFVFRSKVVLEDVGAQWFQFGFSGIQAQNMLTNTFGQLPEATDGAMQFSDTVLLRLPGVEPRFLLTGEKQAGVKYWEKFSKHSVSALYDDWKRNNILAGLPSIFPETAMAFTPQMTNLQLLQGVSFTKGCYIGQEVVARTQYLGKLKRKMVRAHVITERMPQPGDPLFCASSDGSQSIGKIIDASTSLEGGYDLLAVILIAHVENDDVYLYYNGTKLTICTLPYEVA